MEENKNPKTFEEAVPQIDLLLRISAHKWNLKAIASMDFFDVAQIIRLHIWKKFDKYDQSLPFGPWCNTIINNQLRNIRRNVYTSNTRPCLQCPFYEGELLCGFTKSSKQDSSCKLYSRWEKTKKSAFDIRLPLSIETGNHTNEVNSMPFEELDIDKAAKILHEKIRPLLKDSELKVYDLLFVRGLSEDEAAVILGYRTTESRKAGYNNFIRIKKAIMIKVRKAIQEVDIF